MDPTPLIERVLDDERFADGLDEPEAMLLIQALTDRVRNLAARSTDDAAARRQTDELCRQARQIAQAAAAAPSGQAGTVLRRRLAEWPA